MTLSPADADEGEQEKDEVCRPSSCCDLFQATYSIQLCLSFGKYSGVVNSGETEPSHCVSLGEHKREPCYIQGWSRIAFHLSLCAAAQKIDSHLRKISIL